MRSQTILYFRAEFLPTPVNTVLNALVDRILKNLTERIAKRLAKILIVLRVRGCGQQQKNYRNDRGRRSVAFARVTIL
ncbi:MAG: hypothetical protein HY243_06440 [Proteobacteria bacterium]|nr:hypothetical protein [Pseudomonadota bacterium]